jgi:hypothetical protein
MTRGRILPGANRLLADLNLVITSEPAIQRAALPWPEHFECRDKEENAKEHA